MRLAAGDGDGDAEVHADAGEDLRDGIGAGEGTTPLKSAVRMAGPLVLSPEVVGSSLGARSWGRIVMARRIRTRYVVETEETKGKRRSARDSLYFFSRLPPSSVRFNLNFWPNEFAPGENRKHRRELYPAPMGKLGADPLGERKNPAPLPSLCSIQTGFPPPRPTLLAVASETAVNAIPACGSPRSAAARDRWPRRPPVPPSTGFFSPCAPVRFFPLHCLLLFQLPSALSCALRGPDSSALASFFIAHAERLCLNRRTRHRATIHAI
ncbi:uncharacterized protein VTP21DRAFT_7620 [Calcarisporiella thermophila]|uniref:uncharacterized protein n=1 Tax=Calcarisporiella thermophila TaxID=911321 RepID=UPI0037423658